MNSKDKDNKTFQDSLKQFFKKFTKSSGSIQTKDDLVLTSEIERELHPSVPLNHRIKYYKDSMCELVLNNKFDDVSIPRLLHYGQDLLVETQNREYRQTAYNFLKCLCRGQFDNLELLRAQFFRIIKDSSTPDDVPFRFELLQILTEDGKKCSSFEEDIGFFMLHWIPDITAAGKTSDYLVMLVNVIKFNSRYFDEDIIAGYVGHISLLCCSSGHQQQIVLECLQVLDTIVCYSLLPSNSLATFIATLCRTVNHEAYCQNSWKTMRNLLGTHLGHSALHTMCRALQEPALASDAGLLRGAVFHVNMGLWGRQRVATLKCSPTAVLPSFLQALKSNYPVVTYEVMLSVQMLIKKYGLELQDPAWDSVLDIIEAIVEHIEKNPNTQVTNHLHETLCTVEQLMEVGTYNGSIKRVFELIERCAPVRPESSVLRLVSYLATSIVPTRHLWLTKLRQLLERYFQQESRTNVRVKVLDVLSNVIKSNRMTYEDELMEQIVVVHLQNISSDSDVIVRNTAAKLLVNLVEDCESKRCLELLDILEKFLKRPFELYGDNFVPGNEAELMDVKTVVLGLINVFTVKIFLQPTSHTVRIYKMLVSHLEMHYAKPHVFENANHIRLKIFETFLKIRANSRYHIGYPTNAKIFSVMESVNGVRFSPYITVDATFAGPLMNTNSPPPGSPATLIPQQQSQQSNALHFNCLNLITHVSLQRAFKCFVTCLRQEKDWEVLQLILQELPKVLQNKTLILSRQGNNDIDLLVKALYDMITDKSLGLPETLRNTNVKITQNDIHSYVLPVLASLVSYHAYLDSSLQICIVRCFYKRGMVARFPRHCITALTTCTLEMREVMVKLLPEVLLELSKISATVNIAIPILEFLSTLTRIPDVFSSFVGDQYMSVFAISLPYTHPFRYNHYTVSLAHHVIAVWFLKCRLPFRRDFVKFITTGLRTNIIVPFEEGQAFKSELMMLNEDSSTRKRSSSLTEQGSRGRRGAPPSASRLDTRTPFELRPPVNEALNLFHTELTETCVDLMARYTFSLCSALPKRLPTADFLLSGGQSMTWLLGNKLITVTTSGCSQKTLKNGMCDKCWSNCKIDSTPDTETDSKRHSKSTLNRSTSGDDSQSSRVTRQSSSEIQKSSRDSPSEDKKDTSSSLSDNLEQQLPNKLHQLLNVRPVRSLEKSICACWCQGWAEICVRRPTGDMSWVMRIQNQVSTQSLSSDFPLNELSTLYLPCLDREKDDKQKKVDAEIEVDNTKDLSRVIESSFKVNATSGPINIPRSPMKSPSRQNSHESVGDDYEGDIYDDNLKSRNPVRRSNSSPEMSASWKNPFLTQDKIDKMNVFSNPEGEIISEVQKKPKSNYTKDMRVSCEAIPEEMSGLGTTPPANETVEHSTQHHLQSFHSYPGTTPPPSASSEAKTSVTVPTSPNPYGMDSSSIHSKSELLKTVIKNQSSLKFEGDSEKIFNRPKNLSVLNHPLAGKPPQSPTQTSPRFRRHAIDKDFISKQNTAALVRSNTLDNDSREMLSMPIKRDRGHTISVMSQIRKPRSKEIPKSGINPSFVFLQLYHSAAFGSYEKPLLIGQSQTVQRSLQLLDKIPPYEVHKIGVIYVGPKQNNNQTAILRNTHGSLRYVQFLQKLGTMVRLQDIDSQIYFLGGLEQNGIDGKFTYIWHDDVMQMAFHVATLMPNLDHDPSANEKIKHIGNNYVTIVYNDSAEDYDIKTMKGQFYFAWIIIDPLDHNTNRVTVKVREDLSDHIVHGDVKIISDQNLAILTRQLALHANLASMIVHSLKTPQSANYPYASNWLERLRHIKRLRQKVLQDMNDSKEKGPIGSNLPTETDIQGKKTPQSRVSMDDFTEYT